jgi:hypothetical protein
MIAITAISFFFFPRLYRPEYVNSRRLTLTLSVSWLALLSIEYWLGGSASYVDFGDETQSSYIYLLFKTHFATAGHFAPSIAAGADALSANSTGNQFFDLERWLFALTPPWIAYAINKLLTFAIGMSGAIILTRRAVNLPLFPALYCGILYTVLSESWVTLTLAQGLAYSLIPWGLASMCWSSRHRWHWLEGFVVATSLGLTMMPIHSGIPFYSALLVAMVVSGRWRSMTTWSLAAWAGALMVANWAEVLFAMATFAPFSARLNLFRPTFALRSVVTLVPMSAMMMVLAVAFAERIRRKLAFLLPAGLLTVLLVFAYFPFDKVGLTIVKGVDPSYVWLGIYALSTISTGIVLARLGEGWSAAKPPLAKRLAIAMLTALPLALLLQYKSVNLGYWVGLGSQRDLSAVPNLANAPWYRRGFRAVAVPFRLTDNQLLGYGFDTLGGYFNLLNLRLAAFWSNAGRVSQWGYLGIRAVLDRCPRRIELSEIGDLELLKLANARYFVSLVPVTATGLTKVSGPDDDVLPTCARSGMDKLRHALHERMFPTSYYVYEISGALPRTYFAIGSVAAEGDFLAPAFWEDVRRNGPHGVAVTERGRRVAFNPAWKSASISAENLTKDRWSIQVNAPAGGLLVLNSPYVPFWKAEADGQALEIFPVNGIAMGLVIPAGARNLQVIYSRPSLIDVARQW